MVVEGVTLPSKGQRVLNYTINIIVIDVFFHF